MSHSREHNQIETAAEFSSCPDFFTDFSTRFNTKVPLLRFQPLTSHENWQKDSLAAYKTPAQSTARPEQITCRNRFT